MSFEERAEFLLHSIESHNQLLGELTGRMGKFAIVMERLEESIEKLVTVTNQDATAIRTLARIADAHEQRISHLEENS